jgi:hypothetical protein
MNRTRTIVIAFSTLDGIVEDPDGRGETPNGGWLFGMALKQQRATSSGSARFSKAGHF